MSNRSKGNAAEKAVEDRYLAQGGWLVHRAVQSGREGELEGRKVWFSRTNDLFGLFDIAAMRPSRHVAFGDGEGLVLLPQIHFVQVTSETGATARRTKIKAAADGLPLKLCQVFLWIYLGRGKWRVQKLMTPTLWDDVPEPLPPPPRGWTRKGGANAVSAEA